MATLGLGEPSFNRNRHYVDSDSDDEDSDTEHPWPTSSGVDGAEMADANRNGSPERREQTPRSSPKKDRRSPSATSFQLGGGMGWPTSPPSTLSWRPTAFDDISRLRRAEEFQQMCLARLRRYLAVAAPERLNEEEQILTLYGLDRTSVLRTISGTSGLEGSGIYRKGADVGSFAVADERSASYEVLLQLKEQEMMHDLVTYFRLPEPDPRGEDTSTLPVRNNTHGISPTPFRASQVTEYLNRSSNAFISGAQYHYPDDKKVASKALKTASSWEEVAVYVRDAPKPGGFDRGRDATCSLCGLECLNPCELKRHRQRVHGAPIVNFNRR
jgi:hypothetical protein